jgi:hypothetical protein
MIHELGSVKAYFGPKTNYRCRCSYTTIKDVITGFDYFCLDLFFDDKFPKPKTHRSIKIVKDDIEIKFLHPTYEYYERFDTVHIRYLASRAIKTVKKPRRRRRKCTNTQPN